MKFYKKHSLFNDFQHIIDLIFPQYCSVCTQRLSGTEKHICTSCLYTLPTVKNTSFTDNLFVRTFWGLLPIERGTALFFYQKNSDYRNILFDLKYHKCPEIGVFMGRIMANRLLPLGFFDGIDIIVPVPLARQRQKERGYNQSEEIAKGISEISHLPIESKAIVRIVHNTTQTRLQRIERQTNVEGIFKLNTPERLQGKHILLLDDVMTTGATLLACGKAIASLPGTSISILTLAWTKT